MSFINFFGNLVRKKDVYFKYSTSEQLTGEIWIDGKPIYTKTVTYSPNKASVNTDIDLGISATSISSIWFDYSKSFVKQSNGVVSSLNITSGSGWFGIYSYMINTTATSGNIKMNLQSNANTTISDVYITLYYTKK